MKNSISFASLALTAFCMAAAVPQGYYSGLEGKKKSDLKAAAKSASRQHTVISYGDNTWNAFETTDTRTVGGKLCWWDMYSDNNVAVSNGHPGMNIEHSVANSWWGGTKNDAYKDLFHLNPSDAEANNRKSNYPLGPVAEVTWTNGVTTVGNPAPGSCYGAPKVYEPADEYKGDFARAFFYMFTIYDDISWMSDNTDRNYMFDGTDYPSLRPWAYEMLLEWAAADPVDSKEMKRNEAIYAIQHNRNPYIDYPELARYVWGDLAESEFYAADQPELPDLPDDPDDPDDPDNPNDPVIEGQWLQVTSASQLDATGQYILVASKALFGMGCDLINNKAVSKTENVLSVTDGLITAIPTDIAILTLVESGSDWEMRISDSEGQELGFLYSIEPKNLVISDINASRVSITPQADATLIKFIDATTTSQDCLLQYNASSPRFCTYTSSQQAVIMYRRSSESGAATVGTGLETGNAMYDLTGRRVMTDTPAAGIYICNGRKVVVRH